MPIRSMTEEIMDLVLAHGRACRLYGYRIGNHWAPRPGVDEAEDEAVRTFEALRSRLTALETELERHEAFKARLTALDAELEGYRKRNPSGHETPDPLSGRPTIAPECSPRHASLDEAFACEVCNNPARRMQRAIPDSETRIPSSSGIGLSCPSEFVNAQTGYTGEQGG